MVQLRSEVQPALQCIALHKSFGALAAVSGISFQVGKGEMLGVVGPNGAGKTTLFNLLSGHLRCDEGKILLAGSDVTAMPAQRRFRHGLARTFQIPESFASQSVFENALAGAMFGVGAAYLPLSFSRSARVAAEEALAAVGLLDKRFLPAGGLTPFDKKKLMIASALAGRPSTLLLDEPFGGLAESEIDATEQIIRSINRGGMTIIIVEHVLRALFKLVKHVFVMRNGMPIFEGMPSAFMKDETVIASYLGKSRAHLKEVEL